MTENHKTRIVLAPDSFKGTLSSRQVCQIMARAIEAVEPSAEIVRLPVSDGGEGLVDALVESAHGQLVKARVCGPRHEPVDCAYGLLPDHVAVVEMSAAAGLPLMNGALDVMNATTCGVGELIADALQRGSQRILLGLGGSATNDGGCGMAAALGVRFFGRDGQAFIPTGATLHEIHAIDLSGLCVRPGQITALCDVTNPLCGERGASAVYGPQKGATPEMVALLDAGLAHLAAVIRRDCGADVLTLPGGGAAGGMGAAVIALLGGQLRKGAETVLEMLRFDEAMNGASLVLTGEGCMDEQSAYGKLTGSVIDAAHRRNIPVIAVCGGLRGPLTALFNAGMTAAFSIQRLPLPFETARAYSADYLEECVKNIMRCRQAFAGSKERTVKPRGVGGEAQRC
ncbi:MAG: glycerate kinase [Eubacteriales bacterium]|nr:glycerate kinase [Eubacteriales bacterium]